MKLRSYLIVLVVVAVLPVVIFAVVMAYVSYQRQKDDLADGMIERARAISAALDREFLISIQSLKVLAASTHLDKGQLAEFYGDMKGALETYNRAWQNLTLVDSSGQQLINLRRPFGSPLPSTGNPEIVEQVRQSKEAAIANLSPGPVSGVPGIVVHVPVLKEGRLKYVLNAIFYPAPLTDLLLQQKLPTDWIATIIDRNHIIVARTRDFEKFFGKPASSTFAAQAKRHREATWQGTTLDGLPVFAALHRSDFTGWTVGVAISLSLREAPMQRSLLILSGGGLLLFLTGIGLALLFGSRISRPIAALSTAAVALGRGDTPRFAPSPITEANQVALALESAAIGRKRALDSLETRMRQQAAVATLGKMALAGEDVLVLMDEAVQMLAKELGVDYCKVLELLPDRKALLLRAGVGWKIGLVGRATVAAELNSHAGFTLLSDQPVIVEDLRAETRFTGSALLHDHSVVSGVSVIIHGSHGPYGVLGAHTNSRRSFTNDDVNFMLATANVLADAVQRYRAQQELRRARNELEAKVLQRTQELVAANSKLKDLDRLKSEFLATMSHELRTPLNGIIGFAQLMHDGKVGSVSPEHKEYLGDILRCATHLLQLINDILDISKIESGKMEVVKSVFAIDEIIADVTQSIVPLMSAKGLKLIREIPQDLPPITSDRRKLLQILLNLASNAVKFTDQGSITMSAQVVDRAGRQPLDGEGENAKVLPAASGVPAADAMWLELAVEDTGMGIKPEQMELLFKPFSQVDGSSQKRHTGTGLGLYLSQNLATLLGGTIAAASEFGKGSTFTVVLPTAYSDKRLGH